MRCKSLWEAEPHSCSTNFSPADWKPCLRSSLQPGGSLTALHRTLGATKTKREEKMQVAIGRPEKPKSTNPVPHLWQAGRQEEITEPFVLTVAKPLPQSKEGAGQDKAPRLQSCVVLPPLTPSRLSTCKSQLSL